MFCRAWAAAGCIAPSYGDLANSRRIAGGFGRGLGAVFNFFQACSTRLEALPQGDLAVILKVIIPRQRRSL